ncbi:DUF3089 domain-containing protein [Desertimonas flava]|uniref:DUF3089 domain-containing protein n=1 Tax=Desertimonas flava TaxID=2064846 RepID=UPI001D0C1868|nr:DUF3089 domain-containing protein [Desertimonas flava]
MWSRGIVIAGLIGLTTGVIPVPGQASSPPADGVDYADPAHWVCHPDTADVCDTGLDATIVDADGTLTPEPFAPDPGAPVDCFYVYPTISRDPSANSDLVAGDDEERFVAANQVAPLGTGCRVFAPSTARSPCPPSPARSRPAPRPANSPSRTSSPPGSTTCSTTTTAGE